VQQVVNRRKTLGGKHLSQPRADAFHKLHWSGRFQHLKEC